MTEEQLQKVRDILFNSAAAKLNLFLHVTVYTTSGLEVGDFDIQVNEITTIVLKSKAYGMLNKLVVTSDDGEILATYFIESYDNYDPKATRTIYMDTLACNIDKYLEIQFGYILHKKQ